MMIPSLTIARIATPGGPYLPGQLVTIGFAEPTIARILPHEPAVEAPQQAPSIVPESVSAVILRTAAPYVAGDLVILSFLDPAVARVHLAISPNDSPRAPGPAPDSTSPPTHSPLRYEPVAASQHSASGTSAAKVAIEETVPDAKPAVPSDIVGTHAVIGGAEAATVAASVDAPGVPLASGGASPAPGVPLASGGASSAPGVPLASGGASPAPGVPLASGGASPAPGVVGAFVAAADREAATAMLAAIVADGGRREAGVARAASDSGPGARATLILRLDWPAERAARFVRVADKLFTVDKLGWYRHVLALRLLVADEVVAGNDSSGLAEVCAKATQTLRLVRGAGLEALGSPLLAAYLPSFAVTADWLASLELPALTSSLARFGEDVTAFVDEADAPAGVHPRTLTGCISRASLLEPSGTSSVDATLARLMPSGAEDPMLASTLSRYREMLIDLFEQIAPAPKAVRVRQMARPNAGLDDRLWHLVGAVQQSLGSLDIAIGT